MGINRRNEVVNMNKLILRPSYWASVSGGKDSLFMLKLILSKPEKYPLDGVVHFELEIDYPFIKNVIFYMKEECEKHGIRFVTIKPRQNFYELYEKFGFPIKPAQRIQHWQYGDKARKTTCLWLKGLPDLTPTEIVNPGEIKPGGYSVGASAYYARDENGKILPWNDPRTAIIRSKTFQGIAVAMAEQWGDYLKKV